MYTPHFPCSLPTLTDLYPCHFIVIIYSSLGIACCLLLIKINYSVQLMNSIYQCPYLYFVLLVETRQIAAKLLYLINDMVHLSFLKLFRHSRESMLLWNPMVQLMWTEQIGSSSNTSDLYPGHWLSWFVSSSILAGRFQHSTSNCTILHIL
jgi:hypothetical protein